MSRLWSICLVASLAAAACASPPPPRGAPRMPTDGIRDEPLTKEEAAGKVQDAAPRINVCYQREKRQLIAGEVSSYVIDVRIPADGSPQEIEVVRATKPGLVNLEECVVGAIARIRFPAHRGKPLTIRVPIEAK